MKHLLCLVILLSGWPVFAENINVALFDPKSGGDGWKTLLKADGVREVDAASLLKDQTGILIYNPSRQPANDGLEKMRAEFAAFLERGGSIIFTLSCGGSFWDRQFENSDDAGKQRLTRGSEFWNAQLSTLMPVIPWTAQSDRLKRLSTGALAPAGSPFVDCLKTPGFLLPWRFDLHLPYSTIESGQQRYEPAHMGKELLNNDWLVLLTCDQDGRLPLLVSGRYGPGRALVFAGNLFEPTLAAWEGYGEFMKTLLATAAPSAEKGPASAVSALKLELSPAQPDGPLAMTVSNPSPQQVQALLAVKIRNLSGSLRNSFTLPLTVAANSSKKVELPAISPELHSEIAPREADRNSNFLRVEAGVATTDRRQLAATINGIVDRTPALTVKIEGENVNAFPKAEGWPTGGVGFSGGGSLPIERSMYFCGEQPKLRVNVANARHNIAPLAKATDVGWPQNLTAEGLNDLSFTYENIRHKEPAVFGYWAGRRDERNAQQLRLDWPLTVTAVGQRLSAQSDYRRWNLANPKNFTLASQQPLLNVRNAEYTFWQRNDAFAAPAALTNCTLTITDIDPKAPNEPKPFQHNKTLDGNQSNCALGEWEILGWPSDQLPPTVKGTLRVTLFDPTANSTTVLAEQALALAPLEEQTVEITLPARRQSGEVRVNAEFIPDAAEQTAGDGTPPGGWLGRWIKKDRPVAKADAINADGFPVIFIPKGRDHLITRDLLGDLQPGYLCSPGFVALDPFGKGTRDDTQGWGGPDDKVWAWALDLMETGNRNVDRAQYFYLAPARLSHYTDPWRDFPSGRHVWEWATDCLLERFATDKAWQGKKSIHIGLSDRWNGIPIGASFTWADFIRFDQHLRQQGKSGLEGRTRAELNREITQKYADEFQKFELNLYADEMLKSQQRMAAAGIRLTVESHGSFPLAGGELGQKLGQTHKAVGTDLFWEFRDEDLYKSLGYRFGIVAANPDLESGAYNEWGWVSGVLANSTWFSASGDVEPARRQWYSTYWQGRLTGNGEFQPYTLYGFSNQGGTGSKMTLHDWTQFNRVQSRMIWRRPERPAGIGIVASWQLQEHRLTPEAGPLGFGLYAGKGYDQVHEMIGELYARLVKNGVPISFFASTHTLKKWQQPQPLIIADGIEIDPWEIAELSRLNKAGAPIIAVGSGQRAGRGEFFGVRHTANGWIPADGTKVINDTNGEPLAFLSGHRTLLCPVPIRSLDGPQTALLSKLILDICDQPLTLTPGTSATAYDNDGSLYLILGSQSDTAQMIDVTIKPQLLDLSLTAKEYRIIDLDRTAIIPAKTQNGALHFTLPCGPNDGRMIQILPVN